MTYPAGYDPNSKEDSKPKMEWQKSASTGRDSISWSYLPNELKESIKALDGFEIKIGEYNYRYRNFDGGIVFRWTNDSVRTQDQEPQKSNYNARWVCFFCNNTESLPYVCTYCKQKFCSKHRVAEIHDCIKTRYVKYIRKSWLRKYGQDITNGAYRVVCDQCGFSSNATLIESAGLQREMHVSEKNCDVSKIFLEEV